MKKNKDAILDAFMEVAINQKDPEQTLFMVHKLQELLINLFSLYLLMEAKEHEGHDNCTVLEELPTVIEMFLAEFSKDLKDHIRVNLMVNGIALQKTHNQKTFDEIMAQLNQAE